MRLLVSKMIVDCNSNYGCYTSSDKTKIFLLALYCTIIDLFKGFFLLLLNQNLLNILETGCWAVVGL